MEPRELVELAKALVGSDSVRALSVTLLIEDGSGIREVEVHSNGDLFRPFHIGELGFDDAVDVVEYVAK